jgi:phosphatidylserine/phosphatidylglycerophosphate/cardiolipin synthase-like enzyme
MGMFEFTAPHIVEVVSNRMKGKTLNLVLDDPYYDTTMREQTNDATHLQLANALGASLKFSWAAEGADKHNQLHLFPAAYHIKLAVADGSTFFLSSGNLNSTNQPDLDPLGAMTSIQATELRRCDRDWHVIVEHAGLAAMFEDLLLRDLAQATPGQQAADPPNLQGSGNTFGRVSKEFFPAKTIQGPMTVQPALTPDNYAAVVLPLIQGTKKSFRIQTQYIKPSSKFADDVQLPVAERSILEQLIDAVSVLIKNNAEVQIILDSRVTPTMIENLQIFGGIDGSKVRRQHSVHNKSMIIDDAVVLLGSQNWSTEGVDSNRDASLAIQNPQIATYFGGIFGNDWNHMTLPHEDPPVP